MGDDGRGFGSSGCRDKEGLPQSVVMIYLPCTLPLAGTRSYAGSQTRNLQRPKGGAPLVCVTKRPDRSDARANQFDDCSESLQHIME